MDKLTILYVEDDPLFGLTLQLVAKQLGYQCIVASTYQEGKALYKQEELDLLVVDVNLGDGFTGLQLVEELGQLSIPLIYLTSEISDDVFEKAMATGAVTFLNKPISEINLQRTIEMVLSRTYGNKQEDQWQDLISDEAYFVRDGSQLKRVKIKSTTYIEVQDKYCTIHTEQRSYTVRIQLKKLTENLPDNFLQVHRSYVINLDFLDSLNQTKREILIGRNTIPVGRSFYEDLKNRVQQLEKLAN